jgi:hypothetical protein
MVLFNEIIEVEFCIDVPSPAMRKSYRVCPSTDLLYHLNMARAHHPAMKGIDAWNSSLKSWMKAQKKSVMQRAPPLEYVPHAQTMIDMAMRVMSATIAAKRTKMMRAIPLNPLFIIVIATLAENQICFSLSSRSLISL